MINNRAAKEPTETRRAVNLSTPFRRPGWPEENQMFKTQKRFGFTVTFLLFAKRAQGKTTMVPDDGRRAECDHAAALLQTPAKIHVVTRCVTIRIETTDNFESP